MRPDRSTRRTSHVGGVWRNHGRLGLRSNFLFNSFCWNNWGGWTYGTPYGSWCNTPFFGGSVCWPGTSWCGFGSFGFGYRRPWLGNFGTFGRWNCNWYTPAFGSSYAYLVVDRPEPQVIYVEAPVAAAAPAGEFDGAQLATDAAGDAGTPFVGELPGGFGATDAGPASADGLGTDSSLQRELNRASAYYLTQGDRAFRNRRYGDAAHFYAKSVEFSPDSGILYLVLSDALFATGDYRYAAYSIRQALAKEPDLFTNVIDKREFYSDPVEFQEQLRTLERFVNDHVLDMDARLVLGVNYLFGGRAEDSIALLENPFSEELSASDEGQKILEIARLHLASLEEAAPSDD